MIPKQKPYQSRQDYSTPENFMCAVKRRLGIREFVFDFAADCANTKAANWWNTRDDALGLGDWAFQCRGGWGWLNPPFADIRPWAQRCRSTQQYGGSVALLVPAAVGSNWFRDYVDGYARVLLLNGRLAFMPDKPKWLYPKDCMLCLYSPTLKPGYEVWNWRHA